MRLLQLLFLLLISFPSFAQNLVSGGKLKPLQAIMDIRHYTVALDVDPETKTIAGYAGIDLVLSQTTDTLLFNLTDLYKVTKVSVDGIAQSFEHKNHLLWISNKTPFAAKRLKVKVEYGGKPWVATRPPWDGGFTWAKDSLNNPWISVTDEGDGATILFPCKDHPSDEPNEGADMMITVPKGLTVTGPGLLQKVTSKGDKSTFHWKTNYSINNYSILFNVGKYELVTRTYTTVNGNKVPMEFYVLSYHKSKAAHQLDMLERSIRIQEKYFGEYPFAKEKIGICETPHLGMEHQTMNAYGNNFKYTKVGGEDFDWLMQHEFGHEWWANKITNKDWAHYWIQEGICVFGDNLYIRELEGEASYLEKMKKSTYNFQNKKPLVMGEVVTEDDAYHDDIYSKGAFFMHSLRYLLGDSVFFPALKAFATDPKYTYDNMVTTDDVEKHFTAAAKIGSLSPFFNLFLRTTDKLEFNVRQVNTNRYFLKLVNLDMEIPLEITTSTGTQKTTINKKGKSITSDTPPVLDAKGYYFKKVVME